MENRKLIKVVDELLKKEDMEMAEIMELKYICESIFKSDHSEENKNKMMGVLNMVVNLANDHLIAYRAEIKDDPDFEDFEPIPEDY